VDGGEGVAADDLVELGGEDVRFGLFSGKRRVSAVMAFEEEGDRALLGFLRERRPVSDRVHEKQVSAWRLTTSFFREEISTSHLARKASSRAFSLSSDGVRDDGRTGAFSVYVRRRIAPGA
jgi:hypothetical protein